MIDPADVNDLQLEDVEDYSADYAAKDFPTGDGNLHNQDDVPPEKVHYRRARCMALLRANKWFLLLVSVILVIVVVVIAAVAGGGNGSSSTASSSRGVQNQPPIVVDPETIDDEVLDELLVKLLGVYDNFGYDKTQLQDDSVGTTPQKQAYWWIASEKNWKSYSTAELTQRYALASFYYATNSKPNEQEREPGPWVDAYLWLSDEHVCNWNGVVCNSNKQVSQIKMANNNLSGSLPVELAMIGSNINKIDLSSNLIHMVHSHYDVFETFENLQELLMDDNYLQTFNDGLPWQFKKLVNLEKVRLSYNLLAGDMASSEVLEHWTKLTHLEIESNYLTGTMPSQVSQMTNLVYLYMRRNDMEFNLDFLKSDKLVNLFALWLDNNFITGTIPTEIGNLDTLASVSITNSTQLGGPIPSEIGKLTGLRRLWLYKNSLTGVIPPEIGQLSRLEVFEVHNNKLSGQMPQGVCENVIGSGYKHKALTSDCNSKVSCDNCCTKCFD